VTLVADEALVKIYQEGRLTEAQRRLILAKRRVITAPHYDSADDSDLCAGHGDRGIGVRFPDF